MKPILNRVTPGPSGNAKITGPPDPNEQFDFYVSAGHDEYGLVLRDEQATHVWPLDDDEERWDQDGATLAAKYQDATGAMPDGDWDLVWEHIYRISATRAELETALGVLTLQVLDGPDSGDDDTFDYWPSAVRLALSVAEELGGEWPNRQWLAIVERAARAAIAETRAQFAEELLVKCGLDKQDPEPETIDMDRIVEGLRARGIGALVEQTGGGTATIFAGGLREDGERYKAAAGPGYFAGPDWTLGRAVRGDFFIGPDDQGEAPVTTITDQSYAEIVDLIAEVVDRA